MDQRSKCLDSSEFVGGDSGFLSGSCATESEIDVGTGSSTSYHRLDSGVDLGLSVSGLSLGPDPQVIPIPSNPKEVDHKEYADWHQYFYPDEDGDTQLHIAIVEGFVEGVFTLISLVPHPSVLDFQNDAAQTALHIAVLTKQPRVARRLVAAGAKVDMRDRFGNTPLHLAAASGDLGSVQALTTALATHEVTQCRLRYEPFAQSLPQQLDLLNYEGQGPIHLAAIGGHSEVVRTLHWLGADLDLQDGKGGRTALHFAIERGHSATMHTLVTECQASLESRTYGGLTAYELAAESDPYLAQELMRLGATIPPSSSQSNNVEMEDYSSDSSDSESDVP